MSAVWVQLYIGEKKSGDVDKIRLKQPNNVVVEDIADLRVAVKEKCKPGLDYCPTNQLFVYKAGTGFPAEGENSLEPDASVPKETSAKEPLRVLAPAKEQQEKPNNPLDVLVQVLPAMLRELNLTRNSRLNCWGRESARTTGSKRSPKFRTKVIRYYERSSNSQKNVKCQILDEYASTKDAQDSIVASHIWKASTRGQALDEFGLRSEDVNSPRNGMFLTKGIEDAFDNQQICFLYNVLESKIILWVADTSIMNKKIVGSTKKFSDVHEKPLLCPSNHLPYRRILAWHARLTLDLRKETVLAIAKHCTSEYDNSPGRGIATVDPISRAIQEMVEPGDDASDGESDLIDAGHD